MTTRRNSIEITYINMLKLYLRHFRSLPKREYVPIREVISQKMKGSINMKKKSFKLGKGMKKAVATLALSATKSVANSTCMYITHQPKLPETAKKLRKF